MILTALMAHQRKLIRQAVVALLVAANTAAGARVQGTRIDPRKRTDTPSIAVYTLSEDVDRDTSENTAPVELTRELHLEIAGYVKHTDAIPFDDAMDNLAEQIEAAMDADPYLGGTAVSFILESTVMEARAEDGKSDPLIGIVVLTYAVTYRTQPASPAGLVDFITVDATFQIEGGVADTPPAEDNFLVRPWLIDGASGKGVPEDAAQWAALLAEINLAARAPSYGWSFQQASGNIPALFGNATLTALESPLYQQTVTGWTRKACTWSDGDNDRFTNFVDIPNLLTNSFALLGYIVTTNTPAADRNIMGAGLATVTEVRANTAGKYQLRNASGSPFVAAGAYGASVRPLLLVYNRLASSLVLYMDSEKVVATYGVVSGGGVWFGGQTAATPNGGVLFGAAWSGAAAEFSEGDVRALLTQLGWTVAW